MLAVTVTFVLKPNCLDAFLPLMIENASASKEIEPECRQFDICLSHDDRIIFLYEIYDTPQAFEEHLASDHFQRFDAAVADMIAEKTVHRFQRVIQ